MSSISSPTFSMLLTIYVGGFLERFECKQNVFGELYQVSRQFSSREDDFAKWFLIFSGEFVVF